MSRSALSRQAGNVQEREREAEEAYADVLETGRQRKLSSTDLPLWGADDGTFHWHPVLLRTTIHTAYFYGRCCRELENWNAIIDEIYCEVKSMDTFSSSSSSSSISAKQPSTAFCLLLRLLTLRMTDHQLTLTLQHADSPYIRAIGFLYLRYICPPERMIQYIEPYLLADDEEGQLVKVDRSTMSLGQYIRSLFTHRDYFGATPLPRLPGPVEAMLRTKVRAAARVADRATQHYKNADRMHQWKSGSEVMALYGDDETPTTWYRAVIDRVVHQDEMTTRPYLYPRFMVTFPDYGNTEIVRLGELDELQNRQHGEREQDEPGGISNNISNSSRGRHSSSHSNTSNHHHHRRSQSVARGNHHRDGPRQHQPPYGRGQSHYHHQQERSTSHHYQNPAGKTAATTTMAVAAATVNPVDSNIKKRPPSSQQQQQQRTPAELAAIAEKRRKLAAKYG